MSTDRRLKQLRILLDRVERLPESPERARMLDDLRARVVDVETGTTPIERPVRTARKAEPVPPARRAPEEKVPQVRRPAPGIRPAPPARDVSVSPTPDAVEPGELVGAEELLYLGELDLGAPRPDAEGTRGAVLWARGMRG